MRRKRLTLHILAVFAVAKDGSLLITDDGGDRIWRVSHQGK